MLSAATINKWYSFRIDRCAPCLYFCCFAVEITWFISIFFLFFSLHWTFLVFALIFATKRKKKLLAQRRKKKARRAATKMFTIYMRERKKSKQQQQLQHTKKLIKEHTKSALANNIITHYDACILITSTHICLYVFFVVSPVVNWSTKQQQQTAHGKSRWFQVSVKNYRHNTYSDYGCDTPLLNIYSINLYAIRGIYATQNAGNAL